MTEIHLKKHNDMSSSVIQPSDLESQQPAKDVDGEAFAPITFPEGDLRAWLTVLGGFLVLFCTFGAIQSFGVYQDYYTRISLNERPPSDASWIGSLQVCLLFITGLPAGKLFDKGYFHTLLASGSVIYLVSIFLLSLAQPHHYYQNILAQGVGIGLGMGTIFLPSVSVASHYFRRRRSLAMGCIFAGSSAGGIVFPIMQNHVFHSAGGFAWGVRAAAFLCSLFLLSANLLMRTRLPSGRQGSPDASQASARAILSDVPYMICIAGAFFVFWGLFFPFFYLQLFAVLHGVSPSIAIYSISILNSASLLGRTIPNFASDLYGPFNVIIPMTAISGCLIFALFGAGTEAGMVVFALLYGFFSGGFVSIVVPLAASFSTNVGEVGLRIGILCFFVSFAVLTGNPIAGALLHAPQYTWYRPVIFAAIAVLFGTSLLGVSRMMTVKRKGTQRV